MARRLNYDDKIVWGDATFADGATQGTWLGWTKPDWAISVAFCDGWRKDGSFTPLQRSSISNVWRSIVWTETTDNVVTGDFYTWTDNTWHFFATVWNPAAANDLTMWASLKTDVALTAAGTLGTTVGTAIPNVSNSMINGMNDTFDDERYQGDLAFLTFINLGLTEAQCLAIKNNPDVALTYGANLKFYARLCGVDSPETDAAGSGLTGTLTGTTKSSSTYDELCARGTPNVPLSYMTWGGQ